MAPTHLLVLIHGMWGNPNHLAEMHRIITEKYTTTEDSEVSLEVLVAQANRDKSTYDGIDWGGERIVEEVFSKVEDIERDGTTKVTKFSAVGYSLGGLLARYVVGALLTRKFFDNVQPVNFATFATPHFGLPQYGTFRSLQARLGPVFLSRTGEHFYAVDKWAGTERPLLEIMSDKGHVFYQALTLFPHVDIYANAVNDTTVPYVTSALESRDPFMAHETNGIEIKLNKTYEPLIESFHLPLSPPPPAPRPSVFSLQYFRQLQSSRPLLPPALQFRFPMNIVFGILIPILIPLLITALVFRLGLDARASRARIKLLEKDPSSSGRLVNILHSIEKEVDDVVADIMDKPDGSSDSEFESETRTKPQPLAENPVLTRAQQLMLTSLNSLPQLKKHTAFIHPVRNSHAVLVSRDVKRFALHKRGEGVLRHWADHFEV